MDLFCSQRSTIGFRDILGEIAFRWASALCSFSRQATLGTSQLVHGRFQTAKCVIIESLHWSLSTIEYAQSNLVTRGGFHFMAISSTLGKYMFKDSVNPSIGAGNQLTSLPPKGGNDWMEQIDGPVLVLDQGVQAS